MRFLLNLKIKELVNKSNSDLDLTIKRNEKILERQMALDLAFNRHLENVF